MEYTVIDTKRIVALGLYDSWRNKVRDAMSPDTSLTFIPDPLLAITRHTEQKFDLCILGNRVDGQPNAGLYMLERLRSTEDHTPVIVFSHEIDEAGKSRVIELDGHFIDASSDTAATDLSKKIATLLVPAQA
jgi:hypothetical protein